MPLEEKQPFPKNQLLGEILINRHIITAEQLKKVNAWRGSYGDHSAH